MLPGDLIIPVSGVWSRDFRRSFSFLKNRLSALTLSNPGMRGSVKGGVLSLKKIEKLKIEAKILETNKKSNYSRDLDTELVQYLNNNNI